MEWIEWLLHGGWYLTAAVTFFIALVAAGHAIVWKRDSRSAVLLVVVIWMMPLAGPLLYLLLGVNRMERRATALRREDGTRDAARQPSTGAQESLALTSYIFDLGGIGRPRTGMRGACA